MVFSAIGTIATVVGVVGQAKAQKDQAQAQRDSIAAQQRASAANAQRERIQAVRQARINRAQILASAGRSGIGFESSGVVGAESSIASQLGSNIGFQNVQQGFADMASAANQRAADAAAEGASWQAIGGIAGQVLQSQGGWGRVFNPKKVLP